MSLLLHCGAKTATLNDLSTIPLPETTDTYKAVSHHDLALALAKEASVVLWNHRLDHSYYGLARDGKQMFGVHVFKNGHSDLGLSIGFRNSYDKSMSVGIAIGASVFVCDNLALTGDVTIMRKHTVNVWQDLQEMVITTLHRSKSNFSKIQEDSEVMKAHHLRDDDAFRLIGFLYGRGVLTPRQLPVVKKEWHKPTYQPFGPRNMWSFYNACTEALKQTPPLKIMERHIHLHELLSAITTRSEPIGEVQIAEVL
jgi:hypothetical protein